MRFIPRRWHRRIATGSFAVGEAMCLHLGILRATRQHAGRGFPAISSSSGRRQPFSARSIAAWVRRNGRTWACTCSRRCCCGGSRLGDVPAGMLGTVARHGRRIHQAAVVADAVLRLGDRPRGSRLSRQPSPYRSRTRQRMAHRNLRAAADLAVAGRGADQPAATTGAPDARRATESGAPCPHRPAAVPRRTRSSAAACR